MVESLAVVHHLGNANDHREPRKSVLVERRLLVESQMEVLLALVHLADSASGRHELHMFGLAEGDSLGQSVVGDL
tara:strand:+ start:1743 stop:1967 length:225 start_codon:yes stop_codon:yes gene_type:complete